MVTIRPLHPSLQKKAIEELNEVPERIEKDLEALREWIKKSPHIKSCDDDQFLVNFLRGCKYSLERVKEKFDLYHTLKTHAPELTKNRDPLNGKVLDAIRQGVSIPLPMLDSPDGPRYFLIRTGVYDPATYSIEEISKVISMIYDLFIYTDDNFIVAGLIGIFDFTGISISHLIHITPTVIKKITMLQQDAAPVRQKALHFVNIPAVAMTAFNIFQSFMNEKNRKRIHVHGNDMEALYKAVPRKLLPKEYGGEGGTIQELVKNLENELVANREFFLEHEKYGVDENMRIAESNNSESLFGIDGSFRQLTID